MPRQSWDGISKTPKRKKFDHTVGGRVFLIRNTFGLCVEYYRYSHRVATIGSLRKGEKRKEESNSDQGNCHILG